MRDEKLKRLERVARLYYEQDQTQQDIARQLGVSRPFVSRLLSEAKEAGIVEVRIHSLVPAGTVALDEAAEAFGLKGGRLVVDGPDDVATNQALSQAALSLIDTLGGGRLGLGWGHIIGALVSELESRPAERGQVTDVTPLVGNRGIPIRHYHSNENVRIAAQQLKAQAHFLHTPALAETRHELDLLTQTEHYRSIAEEWQNLDIALVNVGTYPSTPDFASGARYGTLLAQRRAVGRLIAYFFNIQGEMIFSDTDYAIQIPLETLANVKCVIGICSANVGPDALLGALRTHLLTHVVARESLLAAALARHNTPA